MQGTSAPMRAAVNDVDAGAGVLNGLKVVAWFTNACVRKSGGNAMSPGCAIPTGKLTRKTGATMLLVNVFVNVAVDVVGNRRPDDATRGACE